MYKGRLGFYEEALDTDRKCYPYLLKKLGEDDYVTLETQRDMAFNLRGL